MSVKLKMYSVRDCKAEVFMSPFFMRTRGEALRGWHEVVNDPQSAFSRHPGDFVLFEMGVFDDNEGTLELHAVPINLGLAIDFKNKPSEEAPLLKAINEVKEKEI